jgi:predicted dehydrogenase
MPQRCFADIFQHVFQYHFWGQYMGKKIGVGIIGASPGRGWAVDAHIPALLVLDDFEFVALSTSRRESADAAAKAFGVSLAFDNHLDLVNCPEVDLVAVTVKVPHHYELVEAVLAAGKAVYCEWPLGNGLKEAITLRDMANTKGCYNAVGLQARSAPVITYVKSLLAEGYVGEVLSSTMVADAINWGADTLDCYRYLLDSKSGASMISIPFGHSIDAFCHSLGEFTELSATTATRRKEIKLIDTGEIVASDVADQLALHGVLESGAVASVHFRGGLSRSDNFKWEINGTEGDLVIRSGGGHIQMLPMQLYGARGTEKLAEMAVPKEFNPLGSLLPDGPSASVARAYLRLATELNGGERQLPGFEEATLRHKMLTAIERSAATGTKQSYLA